MKRRLCLIGLHRWRLTGIKLPVGHNWMPERMCTRCGRLEFKGL